MPATPAPPSVEVNDTFHRHNTLSHKQTKEKSLLFIKQNQTKRKEI